MTKQNDDETPGLLVRIRQNAIKVLLIQGLILLTIFGSIVYKKHKALEKAEAEAALAKAKANEITAFMRNIIDLADPHTGNDSDLRVLDLLEASRIGLVNGFQNEPAIKIEMLKVLGDTYNTLGEHHIALDLLKQADDLSEKGTDGSLELSLVEAYLKLGRFKDAGIRLNHLDTMTGDWIPKPLKVRYYLAKGTYYSLLGNYQEAQRAQEEGLQMNLSKEDSLKLLLAQAQLLESWGYFEEGISIANEVLRDREALLGRDHPSYTEAQLILAQLHVNKGEFTKGDAYLNAVHQRYLRLYDEEHPKLAMLRMVMAHSLTEQNLYPEAKSLMDEALVITRKRLGENHPKTIDAEFRKGMLLRISSDLDGAETIFNQVLKKRESLLGDKHPDYARTLSEMAELNQDRGNYEAAQTLYERVVDLRREIQGLEHPDYAAALNNLGQIKQTRGDLEGVENLYRQALNIRARSIGKKHLHYISTLLNMGGFE